MSFLSKLSDLRKSAPGVPIATSTQKQQSDKHDIPLLPKNYIREEDPAVRRLKDLRRKELLKKGELTKKKTKTESKTTTRKRHEDGPATETSFKRRPASVAANPAKHSIVIKKRSEPLKKLSFDELMKQAESNAKEPKDAKDAKSRIPSSKFSHRKKTSPVRPATFKNSSLDRKDRKSMSPQLGEKKSNIAQKPELLKVNTARQSFAQPNRRIKEKLEIKKQRMMARMEDEYESDLDDFIEDDEEVDGRRSRHDAGFDRDEIWALFNRGKKRSDYAFDDYEDDDMEANEMEIFEEEERARKMAKLEDKREEEWLKRHEYEKKKRKTKR